MQLEENGIYYRILNVIILNVANEGGKPVEIVIKQPAKGAREKVTIEVKQMTSKILRAIEMLSQPDDLTVYLGNKVSLLPTSDVLYIETVDSKTYVYTEDEVYLNKLKLSEIEKLLDKGEFFRVSKQTLINLQKVENISPAGGGRFKAQLFNGEDIVISRQFVPKLKEIYGI